MEIVHDEMNQKFYVMIDGLESYLEYIQSNGIMNILHTYVPYELRGRGIAAKIVKAALEYAALKKLKIIPSCSYVDVYFQRHPEHKNLLM